MIPVTEQNATEAAKDLKTRLAPAKSLAEAMARVMERGSYVQKDKQMTGGGSYRIATQESHKHELVTGCWTRSSSSRGSRERCSGRSPLASRSSRNAGSRGES